jgi:integrase/recombinase XerC
MTTALEWIREYETYLGIVKNRSINTVRNYIHDAESLYRFLTTGSLGKARYRIPLVESSLNWADVTEDNAANYVRALKESGARDTSTARKIYSFRQFFKFLRKKKVVTADPFADMELHAIRRKLPATLSINEMNRVLSCIRQPLPALLGVPNEEGFLLIRDRAMLETLYSAALRVSELTGMDWQDIDWNKRELRVLGKGNRERLCPLGRKRLKLYLSIGTTMKTTGRESQKGRRRFS